MKNLQDLTINNLERTSKSWDRQTKEILLSLSGSGNMFGGSWRMVHITLHGDNSIKETGTITINGVLIGGYNIARGANGENSNNISYFKGLDNFEDGKKLYIDEPTYRVEVKNSCTGSEQAMAAILSAEKDFFIETI